MDLENIMRVMNIPECYAHTLSQLYVILEKESDVINNLRESQDVDSLYIFLKNEYETILSFSPELFFEPGSANAPRLFFRHPLWINDNVLKYCIFKVKCQNREGVCVIYIYT